MRIWKFAPPVLTALAIGGATLAAYATRGRWMPLVFPTKSEPEADAHDAHDHEEEIDRVKLGPEAQANLGLDKDGAVEPLVPTEYWRTLPVPGVVVDRPGESDHGVTSKVAGVVTEIRARPGDTVRPGDPLFRIELASEFLQRTQAELAKTVTDLEFAIVERDRVANLVKAGTTPGAELAKAQNLVDRLATQASAHRRQLLVFGLTQAQVAAAERGEAVTSVTVSAPSQPSEGWFPYPAHAGEPPYEVQELLVERGSQVQAGQQLCRLAHHLHLYVEGHAFASETRALADAAQKRLPVRVEIPGEAPGDWPSLPPLVVRHIGTAPVAGPTFPFYLPLENQFRTFTRNGMTHYAWRFRPGQRVRLRLPVEKVVPPAPDGTTELLPFVLPSGAVVREGAEAFVFVRAGDVFIKRPVRVLYEDRNDTVIARGDVSAAEYVVRTPAAAAINRALKASGDEHGHDHGHEH